MPKFAEHAVVLVQLALSKRGFGVLAWCAVARSRKVNALLETMPSRFVMGIGFIHADRGW